MADRNPGINELWYSQFQDFESQDLLIYAFLTHWEKSLKNLVLK